MTLRLLVLASAIILAEVPPVLASSECLAYLEKAEQYYRPPRGLFYAVALAESGLNGQPHPWTLNVQGQPVYAASRADASRQLSRAIRKVGRNVDVGCMQINLKWHQRDFPSLQYVLDPEYNVWYGAGYLYSLFRRTGSWTTAVAQYHASNRNPREQRSYICSVWKRVQAIGGAADPRGALYCRG